MNGQNDSALKRLRSFLQRYKAIDEIARRAQAEIDKAIAPQFSIFKYFGTDEMRLSNIIADLLDPKGSHGQGELFLKIFLSLINEKLGTEQKSPLALDRLNETLLTLESVTTYNIESNRRRIDILLVNPKWVLAIENKPWAYEQDKQLEDYQEHLNNKYDDLPKYMLYLSGDNSPPTTDSNKTPVVVIVMGYQRNDNSSNSDIFLSDWLQKALYDCRADKLRYFLSDFTGWVKTKCEKQYYESVCREYFNKVFIRILRLKIEEYNKAYERDISLFDKDDKEEISENMIKDIGWFRIRSAKWPKKLNTNFGRSQRNNMYVGYECDIKQANMSDLLNLFRETIGQERQTGSKKNDLIYIYRYYL